LILAFIFFLLSVCMAIFYFMLFVRWGDSGVGGKN
jgi:hypothetical protein